MPLGLMAKWHCVSHPSGKCSPEGLNSNHHSMNGTDFIDFEKWIIYNDKIVL